MISSASLSVGDGGLGVAGALRRPFAVLGCSSSGTVNTPTLVSTPEDVVSTFGYGPLAEALALILALAGGPLVGVRTTATTAAVCGGYAQGGAGGASVGTLSATGTNTSTAIPAFTGTTDKPYAVKIVVTKAGSNLAASPEFKLSLDGGVTFLPTGSITASATPQAIGSTGLLIGWTDGTFVLTDSWSSVGANCPTDADATGATVLTITGTPIDEFDVRLLMTRSATGLTTATAAFKVSLDGGNSYSDEIAVPSAGSHTIPNTGITVAFSDATFVAGDLYRFKTSAPTWLDAAGGSTTNLTAALTALASSGRDFELAIIIGATDAVGAGAVKTWLAARAAAGQYVGAVCEARDQITGETVAAWQTAITGATPGFAGFESTLMDVVAGAAEVQSALRQGTFWRRCLGRLLAARLALIPIREHPGRVKSGTTLGLKPDGDTSSVHHDVRTYTGLDLARFAGLQSIAGRKRGEYYFTSRTMAGATSDFSEVQRIRVMNAAAQAGLVAISEYVGDDVDTKTDGTGAIDEAAAKAIEAEVIAALKRAVMQSANRSATAVGAHVNRTNNILSTRELLVALSVVPKGSINAVTTTIRYSLGGAQ